MDQETARALADLRSQLGQLRTALGVPDADSAEAEIRELKETVTALAEWAAGQDPPFVPPEPQ